MLSLSDALLEFIDSQKPFHVNPGVIKMLRFLIDHESYAVPLDLLFSKLVQHKTISSQDLPLLIQTVKEMYQVFKVHNLTPDDTGMVLKVVLLALTERLEGPEKLLIITELLRNTDGAIEAVMNLVHVNKSKCTCM